MIERWFSDDPHLYSQSKLTAIVSAYPWRSAQDKLELTSTTLKNILRNRSIVAVLLALPYALLVVRGGKTARWAVALSAAGAVALIVLVTFTRKTPPERVTFSLLSFPLAAALMSFAWRNNLANSQFGRHLQADYLKWLWSRSTWRATPWPIRVVLSLMIVAMVMGVYRQARRTAHVGRDRIALQKFLDAANASPEKLYVVWEAALPYEVVSPLDSLDQWSQPSFLSLTWNQGTPWSEATKQHYRITRLAQAIYQRNDIELVATPEHCKLFKAFAKEHFGGEINFVARMESRKRFVAGRFEQTLTETATSPANRTLR
jgi:hypothetical protein